MTTPAIRASSDLYCARIWPTSVEIAPSVMKTMLKPMMNAAELSITLRKSCPSCDFSSSTPTPEISETYPGTSGSTQGERNDTRPATKAAMGRGRLVMQELFYPSEGFAYANMWLGVYSSVIIGLWRVRKVAEASGETSARARIHSR